MAKAKSSELVRVKILTSFSGVGFSYAVGEIVELEADVAQSVIDAGYGEEVK